MKKIKLSLTTILFFLVLLSIWGVIIEPRYLLDVQEHDVEVPNLGADWEGKKVALLADLQVGMWWGNIGMVKKAVKKAVETKPDITLIAGDFIYKPDSLVVEQAISLIQPLIDEDIPVVAVLGNHDYSLSSEKSELNENIAEYLIYSLKESGVIVLDNESHTLEYANRSSFHVVGIGSTWAGKSDIDRALSKIPPDEPRVIFMHNPVVYRDIPADQGPFTVAAHTHGGQIRFPLLPSQSWLDIAKPREVIADGWALDDVGQGNNRLYVNRGIGFSILPARFMCRPELTIFSLYQTHGSMEKPESK